VRAAFLLFFTSSFWALLPAAARELSKSRVAYGFLLAFFGVGAVLGAVVLQRARSKLPTETILSLSTVTFAAVILGTALLRTPALICVLMLFGGASWTVFMSIFNITAQKLAPDWVRACSLFISLYFREALRLAVHIGDLQRNVRMSTLLLPMPVSAPAHASCVSFR
jgi:predicted MFS family arabinose efflux permease